MPQALILNQTQQTAKDLRTWSQEPSADLDNMLKMIACGLEECINGLMQLVIRSEHRLNH